MNEDLTINKEGLDLIKKSEGYRSKAYLDSVDVKTIGYGTTHYPDGSPVLLGDVVDEDEATEYLLYDIKDAENAIKRYVIVPLSSNQFSALVSWVYNLGSGSLRKSDMLKCINAGDFVTAAVELKKWHHAGGVELPGLVIRRQAEANLFLSKE